MKRAVGIGLISVAVTAIVTIVSAWSRSPEPVTDAQPAHDIVTRANEMGLDPIGQPQRRGPYYVLQAQDRRGRDVRVVADAQSGDIVSVAPVRVANAADGPPRLSAAPRIIHVPQPGDDNRASLSGRDELSAAPDDDPEEAAPPPRPRVRQVMPRPQRQSDTPQDARRKPYAKTAPPLPPAPVERRTVLRAPPSLHDGPSPVRPTPRFSAKAESGEKFPPPPPPGYTPPANLPTSEPPPSAAPQADAAQGD
jgi:hypothetical protein